MRLSPSYSVTLILPFLPAAQTIVYKRTSKLDTEVLLTPQRSAQLMAHLNKIPNLPHAHVRNVYNNTVAIAFTRW